MKKIRMTTNYQFKKDNLEQGETSMRKEADLDLLLGFPGGVNLSSLPWRTATGGGRKGCEKGFVPPNTPGQNVCPCVEVAAATPGVWNMPVRCLVKKIQPTGESFSDSSVIYAGFKENIRHPLIGPSALQHLKNVFYKSRVEAEGKIYPSAKGQCKVSVQFIFSK